MCNIVAHTKCRTQIEEANSSKSKHCYMPSCLERGRIKTQGVVKIYVQQQKY